MTIYTPTAGQNRDQISGKFQATLFSENLSLSHGRQVTEFPKPNPMYRSLNQIPPALLERTPAPFPNQTFRNGRNIGDRSTFSTAFDDQFRTLDSYESLFGPFERSYRHINSRNLALAGIDPSTVAKEMDLRHTEIHTTVSGEFRVRAWIGVNPEEGGLRFPPSAEYPIEDQMLGQLAARFDVEDLYHDQQLRNSIAGGSVSPWSILSPTDEQVKFIGQLTAQANTAATTTGVAHIRLGHIHEALDRIAATRPLASDWKLDVGMDLVNERTRQVATLDQIRLRRQTALGVEVRILLESEQAMYKEFVITSQRLRDILGLEEMKAREHMQKMVESTDEYQRHTWEAGFPGQYGSAPRLPNRGPLRGF
jgi:hypothetical protein